MSFVTIKDSEGKEYLLFDESELYDDKEMGDKIEDFEILQILGKGSYGFVAKIRSLKNKKIYAMKQIDLSKVGSDKERQLCKQEIQLLQQLDHPNINKYYKSFINNECLYIIMEFMDNGDISGFINAHKKFKKPVREEEVWNILLQSMNALSYIHQKKIIHRDIKPANLFMTNNKTIKIGDFGVSAKMESLKTSVREENFFSGTIVGTPLFMSPEMINNDDYDQKTDVYSMGCAIFELCYFQPPRKAAPSSIPGVIIFQDLEINENKDYYSEQLKKILNEMIEINPEKRLSSKELCQKIRSEYIKTFLKTSSLSSVVRCFYSLPKLTKQFLKLQNNNEIENKRVSKGYLNMILNIKNNINNKFNEFKEILATENPIYNTDEEIDPKFVIAFLLEKMHKELNRFRQIQTNEEQYIINSTFNGQDEDKSNKAEMIDKFVKHFSENFNSYISNLFFGMLKEKLTCQNCSMISYNFGCFCLLTFDLNEFCKNFPQKQNLTLIDLFNFMNKKNKQFTIEDHITCDRCLSYQMHIQEKHLYSMPLQLIISLERGSNCMNKSTVNFPPVLDVSQFVESPISPKKFNLVGTVNRADINKKEHYISFTKDLNSQNWVCSDDTKINQVSQDLALTYGIPILLFYDMIVDSNK